MTLPVTQTPRKTTSWGWLEKLIKCEIVLRKCGRKKSLGDTNRSQNPDEKIKTRIY